MAKELKLTGIANHLASVKAEIEQVRETLKILTDEEDNVKEALLAELQAKKVKSVDAGGFIFTRAIRSGYEITDDEIALDWAKREDCVAIDKKKMAKILKGSGALPDGVEFKETEYVSVSAIKDEV